MGWTSGELKHLIEVQPNTCTLDYRTFLTDLFVYISFCFSKDDLKVCARL